MFCPHPKTMHCRFPEPKISVFTVVFYLIVLSNFSFYAFVPHFFTQCKPLQVVFHFLLHRGIFQLCSPSMVMNWMNETTSSFILKYSPSHLISLFLKKKKSNNCFVYLSLPHMILESTVLSLGPPFSKLQSSHLFCFPYRSFSIALIILVSSSAFSLPIIINLPLAVFTIDEHKVN